MAAPRDLLIRNVEIEGRAGLDVLIRDGVVAEIGQIAKADAPTLDGNGGALLPGLHDHHIHLLALAADRASIHVGPGDVTDRSGFEAALREADKASQSGFLRAVHYHESVAGPLDRDRLDALQLKNPLRVQYRTGSLWVLNSAALARVLPVGDWPDCVERDQSGRPTGRIWRGDAWLRTRLSDAAPDLADVGAELARYGITGVTDTSVTTGASEAALFSTAKQSAALPQRLLLMSGGNLPLPPDNAYEVGPVKILLDDHALGDMEPMLAKIGEARLWWRNVAVHCVTLAELAFTLAAFDQAGSWPGDRIEHGGIVTDDMLSEILRLQLTIVTQPSFIAERGDTYLKDVDSADLPFLYRCRSLQDAGIPLAASSDAPYSSADPWKAIAAASERRSGNGKIIGENERISPLAALNLFLGAAKNPGGAPKRVEIGEAADLCLLRLPLERALQAPSSKNVAATIIEGRVIYRAI